MAVIYSESGPKDVTGNGHFMETQAWLDTNRGHIEAITHLWTTNWALGFTGSVGMLYLGTGGRPLSHSQAEEFGVDGRSVFWQPSSRTEAWSHNIAPNMASNVNQILIIHSHAPRNRLGDILTEMGGYAQTMVDFCLEYPLVCIEVGGLL